MPTSSTNAIRPAGPSPWATYLGPIALTVLFAWASVNYFAGGLTQRVSASEAAILEQKETNKRYPTREEIDAVNAGILRELNSIHDDVRAIDSKLERKQR